MLSKRILCSIRSGWARDGDVRQGGVDRGKEEKKSEAKLKWNPMRYETRLEEEPTLAEEKKKMEADVKEKWKTETWERVWKTTELWLESLGEAFIELDGIEGEITKEDLDEIFDDVATTLVARIHKQIPGMEIGGSLIGWIFSPYALFEIPKEHMRKIWIRADRPILIHAMLANAMIQQSVLEDEENSIARVIASPEFKNENPKAVSRMMRSLFDLATTMRYTSWQYHVKLWHVLKWDSIQNRRDPQLLDLLFKERRPDTGDFLFRMPNSVEFMKQFLDYYRRSDHYPRIPKDLDLVLSTFRNADEKVFLSLLPPGSTITSPNLVDVAVLSVTLYVLHEYLFQVLTLPLFEFGTPDEEFKVGAARDYFASDRRLRLIEDTVAQEVKHLRSLLGKTRFCSVGDVMDRLLAGFDPKTLFVLPYERYKISGVVNDETVKTELERFLRAVKAEVRGCLSTL